MGTMIERLLDDEIERNLRILATVEDGSDESRSALIRLKERHAERSRERENFIKEAQQIDASEAKKKELELREKELNLRDKQLVDETLAKSDELRIREKELNLREMQLLQERDLKNAELAKKDAELVEAKKTRRWKTVLDILGITVPTAATGFWLYKGLKFEEEGKILSSRASTWFSGISRLFTRKG